MSIDLVLAVVLPTLLAGIVVPITFMASATWRFRDLDATAVRRVLRTAVGTGLLFGAVGGVVAILIAAASGIPWVTAAGSSVVIVALAVWSVNAAAPLKRVHRLAQQLEVERTRESARKELLAIAATAPADAVGQSIRISVATALSNGRLHVDARRILEALGTAELDAHERELRALGLFACCVYMRDLEAARAALAAVPPLEPGSIHAASRARVEALLLVYEGKPDQALALIATPFPDPDGERSRRVVLAHAHAANADERSMTECLAWLEQHHGREALSRVVEPEGPASSAAWSRMQGHAAPYRR